MLNTFLLLLLLLPLVPQGSATTTTGATSSVWFSEWTVVRGQAELPCVVPRPMDPDDQPLLALWYKETQPTVPIYSYDTRSGSFSEGVRWADKEHLGQRAFFRIMSDPPTLVMEDVKVADQAVYTCRVDYKVRASAITKVNLTVIVPPGPPIIFEGGSGSGAEVTDGRVGPLREGDHTHLNCGSSGGSPTPTLTWWRDGERLHQVGHQGEGGVESRISVVASRTLQGATLTCQALNNNITEPAATSLTLDLLLKPQSVEIVGSVDRVLAGVLMELVCRVVGSRPPATITWWRGARNITHVITTVLNDGNVTTGAIKFAPTRLDDGKRIRCIASNPEIPNSEIEESALLTVRYKPEVELTFGRALDPRSIKEGDDVYFDCSTHANPPVHRVNWFHNREMLQNNHSAGLIISATSLVLQKVRRERAGLYTCAAHNLEGRGVSNAVTLNVMFAPVCSSPGKKTQGVARTESVQVLCQVNAFPPQVNFTWRFNGSTEGESLPLHAIKSQGTTSLLNYTAAREQDYGTLLCWAHNVIGSQKTPCIVHLIPAGPPSVPRNCSITNRTSEALVVVCWPGSDGGLPQHFVMEASHEGVLLSNTSSLAPEFVVRGLEPGMGVKLTVRAINSRGTSESVFLDADVMKVAEKRMGPPEEGIFVPPVIGGVAGGVAAILVLVVAGLVFAHHARHTRPTNLATKDRSPPSLTNVYVRGSQSEDGSSDSGNPDIIKGMGEEADCVGSGEGGGRCMEAGGVLLQGDTVPRITDATAITKDEPQEGAVCADPHIRSRENEEPSLYSGHIPPPYLAHPSHVPHSSHINHPTQATHPSPHPSHPTHPHYSIHPTHHPTHSGHLPTYPSHSIHPSHGNQSSSHPPYASHIHQGVLDPGELGPIPPQYSIKSTTSLHDLAEAVPSGRSDGSSHGAGSVQHNDGARVYSTMRRGGDRGRESPCPPHPDRHREPPHPPHPRAVTTFLATNHQESAV